jgi:hypothetical protein
MATPLETTRATLREHLSTEIADAINQFDAKDALLEIQNNFLSKAYDTAKEITGIDERWGQIDLSSRGLIRSHIEPKIKEMVVSHLTPVIEAEVPKLFAQKAVKDLIVRRIRQEVKDSIQDLGGYKCVLREQIRLMVAEECQTVFRAWVDGQEDDTWLARLGT